GLIAILIKLNSGGPALYAAPRAGRKGRAFRCYKFRTMVKDADELKNELRKRNQREGPCFKIKNDPRITWIGRFLRRYSLDELPQLTNVLRGEMSLVGPRPLQLRDSDRLLALDPTGYARRLQAMPGLTGAWQVGGRSEVDCERMVQLDLEYIENWSMLRD